MADFKNFEIENVQSKDIVDLKKDKQGDVWYINPANNTLKPGETETVTFIATGIESKKEIKETQKDFKLGFVESNGIFREM